MDSAVAVKQPPTWMRTAAAPHLKTLQGFLASAFGGRRKRAKPFHERFARGEDFFVPKRRGGPCNRAFADLRADRPDRDQSAGERGTDLYVQRESATDGAAGHLSNEVPDCEQAPINVALYGSTISFAYEAHIRMPRVTEQRPRGRKHAASDKDRCG